MIDPHVMGGKPCIRGIRITVGAITGVLASCESIDSVLGSYPSLERDDVYAALAYALCRVADDDLPRNVEKGCPTECCTAYALDLDTPPKGHSDVQYHNIQCPPHSDGYPLSRMNILLDMNMPAVWQGYLAMPAAWQSIGAESGVSVP